MNNKNDGENTKEMRTDTPLVIGVGASAEGWRRCSSSLCICREKRGCALWLSSIFLRIIRV